MTRRGEEEGRISVTAGEIYEEKRANGGAGIWVRTV